MLEKLSDKLQRCTQTDEKFLLFPLSLFAFQLHLEKERERERERESTLVADLSFLIAW